jgi:hypothetical protein
MFGKDKNWEGSSDIVSFVFGLYFMPDTILLLKTGNKCSLSSTDSDTNHPCFSRV